mmetsp:Transcript_74657/g.228431  ORF Transcript_74657/g.228431 Transcript_74657/m.228431 type:complete len:245 (+) Transcript_74657:1-735(+)
MEGDHVLVQGARVQIRHAADRVLAVWAEMVQQHVVAVHPTGPRVRHAGPAHRKPHARQDVGNPHDATEQTNHVEAQAVSLRQVPLREVLQDTHDAQHPHHADYPEQATELREPQHLKAPASSVICNLADGQARPVAQHHRGVRREPRPGVPGANSSRIHLQLAAFVKPRVEGQEDVEGPKNRCGKSRYLQPAGERHVPSEHVWQQGEVVNQHEEAEDAPEHVETTVWVNHEKWRFVRPSKSIAI